MQLSVNILLLLSELACFVTVISWPITETTASVNSIEAARIVNGFDINITEIPYQATIRRKYSSGWSHICGAVLISKRATLTAAHCVDSFESDPSLLRVVVGTSYRLSGGKKYDVSHVIVHEMYSSKTLDSDIAILVTEKDISFTTSIATIPTAPQSLNLPEGTEALVSGFGTTLYAGSPSETLQAARVYITSQSTCTQAYTRISNITEGMLCANSSNPSRDACQGDSGGPLVAKGYLVGLVSWGEICASAEYPGVYTRVSQYYSWITENLLNIYNV